MKDKACVFKYSNYLQCGIHVKKNKCGLFFFVSCFYRNTECSLWFQHSFRPLIALPSVTITYSNVKLCIWTDTVLTLLLLSSLYSFQHKSLSPILFVTFGFYLFIYLFIKSSVCSSRWFKEFWLVANCKVYILTRSFSSRFWSCAFKALVKHQHHHVLR